jgi:lipopolysaccharide/colanic/teichoic acid biosynthesis glycosyltransferase
MYKNIIKPFFDLVASIIIFLILSPIFIIVTILLAIVNEGKPFFFQERPGKNERIFKVIKFKTMTDKKDKNGNLLPDNKRITKIGSFIRKSSIDEIPQLINVIKGDMSIIGPRPLLVRYLELYSDFQKRRHEVKPGITGWAQINGRNTLSWNKKFELDVFYIDNMSFSLDLKIFYLSVYKVFKREGINQSDKRPMQPFKGN